MELEVEAAQNKDVSLEGWAYACIYIIHSFHLCSHGPGLYVQFGRPNVHIWHRDPRSKFNFTLYSFAFGFSCLSIACATIRRWILPVAVLGMLSVK